jgi:hypothetical protein
VAEIPTITLSGPVAENGPGAVNVALLRPSPLVDTVRAESVPKSIAAPDTGSTIEAQRQPAHGLAVCVASDDVNRRLRMAVLRQDVRRHRHRNRQRELGWTASGGADCCRAQPQSTRPQAREFVSSRQHPSRDQRSTSLNVIVPAFALLRVALSEKLTEMLP